MSSSSSSSSSASPEPPSKRRREEKAEDTDNSDDSDDPSSDSEEEEEQNDDDDTPALSHAEKRRQKKKEKLAALKGDTEAPPTKKRKLDSGKAVADSTIKRQNSVWVGNMSFKTTPEALRKFFDGVGEITRIHMPMKIALKPNMPAENRGFAYVDFATPDAKIIAITLSEKPLVGRKLLIKDGDDFAGRPAAPAVEESSGGKTHSKTALKILRAQKQPPAPTLFLGNLPFETTEDHIRQLLDAHRRKSGKEKKDGHKEENDKEKSKDDTKEEDWIRKIRLGTFEDSGACKGFAFVDFFSTDNATSALINPKNHHLNGRNLVVEYASADAVKRGPNKPKVVDGEGGATRDSRKKPGSRLTSGRSDKPFRKFDRDESKGFSKKREEKADSHQNTDVVEHEPAAADHSEKTVRRSGGRSDDAPRHKGPRNRPKPGAALAQAKRQSAAIVPTSGKKIVF